MIKRVLKEAEIIYPNMEPAVAKLIDKLIWSRIFEKWKNHNYATIKEPLRDVSYDAVINELVKKGLSPEYMTEKEPEILTPSDELKLLDISNAFLNHKSDIDGIPVPSTIILTPARKKELRNWIYQTSDFAAGNYYKYKIKPTYVYTTIGKESFEKNIVNNTGLSNEEKDFMKTMYIFDGVQSNYRRIPEMSNEEKDKIEKILLKTNIPQGGKAQITTLGPSMGEEGEEGDQIEQMPSSFNLEDYVSSNDYNEKLIKAFRRVFLGYTDELNIAQDSEDPNFLKTIGKTRDEYINEEIDKLILILLYVQEANGNVTQSYEYLKADKLDTILGLNNTANVYDNFIRIKKVLNIPENYEYIMNI